VNHCLSQVNAQGIVQCTAKRCIVSGIVQVVYVKFVYLVFGPVDCTTTVAALYQHLLRVKMLKVNFIE